MTDVDFETRTVDLAGSRLHVQTSGPRDAPVILMAHGLGNDLHLWDEQTSQFMHEYRVVRFDSFGHGKSTGSSRGNIDLDALATHVIGILDALQIECGILIGTSMGAVIGLAAAARAPQRFSHLVLCGARLHTKPGAVHEMRARAAQAGREGLAAVADAMMQRWFPREGLPVPKEVIDGIKSTLLGTDPAVYAACAGALVDYDLRPALRTLSMPVLLVSGELDQDIPQLFETLAAELPGLTVSTMRAVGHFPNLQNVDAFNSLVRNFLATNYSAVRNIGGRQNLEE
ncbi:alpha/beta fold hydrolase [Polaromonas sp. P1-6]|nr:alpha/beta fold hydrolase [Polaromonas sp. P1-6]